MKLFRKITSTLGIASILVLSLINLGSAWQAPPPSPMGPPMGAPMGPPMGPPAGPPMGMPMGPPMGAPFGDGASCAPAPCGPPVSCAPPSCGPTCNNTWELGGRLIYVNNEAKVKYSDSRADVDFIRDLNFSSSYLTGEVYGALRFSPCFALTYTFRIPRQDGGWGRLPSRFRFDGVTIPEGSTTNWKFTPYLIRQEAEYYLMTGCNLRVGAIIGGDVVISETRVEYLDPQGLSHTLKSTPVWGIPSVGGIAEYSPMSQIFLRFKGLYEVVPTKANGFTLDGDIRAFPEFGGSCGGPSLVKAYLGAGYRYTNVSWNESDNADFFVVQHGPYAELGVIF